MPESQIYIPYRKGFAVKIRYLNPNWGVLHICSGNNIALQVNIRSHENSLVLNSLINWAWGQEERPAGFPFDVDREIFVSVGAGADGFYISAGIVGSPATFTYKYAYRLPETKGLYQIYANYANLEDLTILPNNSELIGQSAQSFSENSDELSLTKGVESEASAEPAYLEFSDIDSYKFYEVSVDGVEVIIRYGRIGTSGQISRTTYATPEKARTAACKKLNEKLKKGYVPAVMGDRPPRPPRSLDIAQFIRLAWKPIITEGDSSLLSSKFSGKPWLAKDEPWPTCPLCDRFMQLFFQLNTSELPELVRPEFGSGLLQMFYCCNWGCEGQVESAVVFYGRVADINKNLLIRLVQPNGEASTAPIPLALEDYFPAKTIVDWQQLADYPDAPDEIVALIYGWEQVNDEALEDEVVERLGFYDLEDYCEHRLTYEGDKLAGYPRWVQGMEYSGCPICREPMRQVFQLASNDNLPYMFGDAGIGHVLQCKTHKEQFAFIWACS
ncbi:MAG TPA: molybdate metabolism regulator [Cyanobacteria bacterium UBA8803]|nr:molybdate metabolism regulator [Cyanobacteria bacterium UBA9273]HBL58172.1 molybdate metabolism regulator [Cyanobacteria bacterium UBA8803]